MAPLWIRQTFLPPGRRLKLHPDDIYPYGADKGGVCERWFCSTGMPGADGVDESTVSYFYLGKDDKISFPEAICLIGNDLLGKETMDAVGTFKMFAKLYDFGVGLLPLHMHPKAEYANKVGREPKPETSYFPVELNSRLAGCDHAFMGIIPGTSKDRFLNCIKNYNKGENDVLTFCQGYKIKLGTVWYMPAGLLHAPASVVAYEPQLMSDSLLFYQNIVDETFVMGNKNVDMMIPEDFSGDRAEYLLEILDWEGNLENFKEKYLKEPAPVKNPDEMSDAGYFEEWLTFGMEEYSTKRLRVLPGRTAVIKDAAAYGFVMMQGYGAINCMEINTPNIIRYGQQTADEGFVSKPAATEGVVIENLSQFNDLVMLKHFSCDNKEALE
jgi:hypothetical protein